MSGRKPWSEIKARARGAPVEDVEELAKRLEALAAWFRSPAGRFRHASAGDCVDAAATLRELSRKLEEANKASHKWWETACKEKERRLLLEAALEEARRERDAIVEAALANVCTIGCGDCDVCDRINAEATAEFRRRALSPQPQARPTFGSAKGKVHIHESDTDDLGFPTPEGEEGTP